MSEIEQGQSRIQQSKRLKPSGAESRRLLPFVLPNLLSVCFRGASATSNAILMLPSSFSNRLVSLDFYDTLVQQKELAFAFGGRSPEDISGKMMGWGLLPAFEGVCCRRGQNS
ncbi:hypothetical protein, partial [Thioclava dalianensis]|uniref:hypothetical protein n=1 Tax=Thioclava dalianensis TaxID=1185766 RepID=UPI001B80717A